MPQDALTMELAVVALLAGFAASLWIPYIVGVNLHPQQGHDPFDRPAPLTGFPPWVHRAHRAHLNLLEQFLPFAVLVLVIDRIGAYSALTYWATIVFALLRVAHAIGMISGRAGFPTRPVLFVGGWLCCLALLFASLTA